MNIRRQLKVISVALTLASTVLTSPLSHAQTHKSLVEANTYINYNGINIFIPQTLKKNKETDSCVNSVETVFHENNFYHTREEYGQYARKYQGASGKFNINMLAGAPIPPNYHLSDGPNNEGSHIQGLARINTSSGAWMVFTRIRGTFNKAAEKDLGIGTGTHKPGELFVVKLDAVPEDHQGGKFVKLKSTDGQFNSSTEYDGGRDGFPNFVRYIHRFEKSSHPGGIQAAGNLVAIPHYCDQEINDCDHPFIQFWDFSNPIEPKLVQEHELKSEEGELKAFTVAFAKEADGSYLLIVERENGKANVLRTIGYEEFSSETKWIQLHDIFLESNAQGMSLIRECGSDRWYLIGFTTTGKKEIGWTTDNDLQIFRIDGVLGAANTKLTKISSVIFGQDNEYCQFRGGASIYVTPDKKPILYCSSGWAEPVKKPSQKMWESAFSYVANEIGKALLCAGTLCVSELFLKDFTRDGVNFITETLERGADLSIDNFFGDNSRVMYLSEITAVKHSAHKIIPKEHILPQPGD